MRDGREGRRESEGFSMNVGGKRGSVRGGRREREYVVFDVDDHDWRNSSVFARPDERQANYE